MWRTWRSRSLRWRTLSTAPTGTAWREADPPADRAARAPPVPGLVGRVVVHDHAGRQRVSGPAGRPVRVVGRVPGRLARRLLLRRADHRADHDRVVREPHLLRDRLPGHR